MKSEYEQFREEGITAEKKKYHHLDFTCEHVVRFIEHCQVCERANKCKYHVILYKILKGDGEIDYRRRE